MELTPAAEIGANFPKYFLISGVPRSAIISRKILVSRAIVPSNVEYTRQSKQQRTGID